MEETRQTMEEVRRIIISVCNFYNNNKEMLLRTHKHEDFIISYNHLLQTMTPEVWDAELWKEQWEKIPMDIKLTHTDLQLAEDDD